MSFLCPRCGSDEIRLSRRKGLMRRVMHVFGVYSFRCEDCDSLFNSRISAFRHIIFAKCPTCHRMDLGRWSREFYSPRTLTKVMLAIGANPIRCEYCRNNFWSFRLVREKFSKEKRMARSHVVTPAGASSLSDSGIRNRGTPTLP